MQMAVYNISGAPICDTEYVFISKIKAENPSYTDDQLLASAILNAQNIGKTAVVVWDGTDIHFSGSVTHLCTGFSGIDFNGSRIYMPNYDGGTILQIEPDNYADITVPASDILRTYTTNNNLKGKVFQLNTNYEGNDDMCLGRRLPTSTYDTTLYSCPTVKASPDGFYMTGELFLVPETGNVVCYNVHDFPNETFVLKNAEIVSYASANMSILAACYRSNAHFHHFKFTGRSNVTTFHNGPFVFYGCSDIEIDHFYGINPIQQSLTSGYIFSLNRVSNAHVHDVAIGDSVGWGAIGCGNLTNTVFERCYLDRWDCHYAQYGYQVIRDCVLNHAYYGIGNGSIIFENCTFLNNFASSNDTMWWIAERPDIAGAYDGDIIIRNCEFLPGKQAVNKCGVLNDRSAYAKPSNSAVNVAPKKNRHVVKCRIPDGSQYIFQTGTIITADQPLFANLVYNVEDTIIGNETTILHPLGSQSAIDVTMVNYHKKIAT